jgi:hypothetical protein
MDEHLDAVLACNKAERACISWGKKVMIGRYVQRDNYDGRLPTIKLAKSGSRRVARRELPF